MLSMPDADALWNATSLEEWSDTFERVHEFSGGYSSLRSGVRPLSLYQLYYHFANSAIVSQGIELTPVHLRLLLCPLQVLVHQTRQTNLSPASLRDLYTSLQRWFILALRYTHDYGTCPRMQTSLVLFHLISLNIWTDFPAIEQVARGEASHINVVGQLRSLYGHHILETEQATYHCGQVIRLIRRTPDCVRPPWWPGALYRVALILWFHALTMARPHGQQRAMTASLPRSFPIDVLDHDHPVLTAYLTSGQGTPLLTRHDGSRVGIADPVSVLLHCADVVAEGVATRFRDGVCNKLWRLAARQVPG